MIEKGVTYSKCKKWAKGESGERITEWSDKVFEELGKREHHYLLTENGEVKEERKEVLACD